MAKAASGFASVRIFFFLLSNSFDDRVYLVQVKLRFNIKTTSEQVC